MDPYQILGVTPYASDDEIKTVYRKLSRMYHPDANIGKPDAEAAEEKFKQVSWAYEEIMKAREEGYDYASRSGSGFGGAYGSSSTYRQSGTGSTYKRQSYSNGSRSFTGSPYGSSFQRAKTAQDGAARSGGTYSFMSGAGQVLRFDLSFINTIGLGNDTHIYNAAINYLNQGMYNEAAATLDVATQKVTSWYFLYALANLGMGNIINAHQYATVAYNKEPDNPQYWQLLDYINDNTKTYQEVKSEEYRFYHRMPAEMKRFNTAASCISFGACLGFNLLCNESGIYFCSF